MPPDDHELSEAERRLAEIEGALERLEDGSYGRCAVCGEPVAAADLEADPLRSTCARCSTAPGEE